MEISFLNENEADIAAKREKLLARLEKRRAACDNDNTSKKAVKDLDDLLQKASLEINAKTVIPQTVTELEKLLPSSSGRTLKRIQDILEDLRQIELAEQIPQNVTGFSFTRKVPSSITQNAVKPTNEMNTTTKNVLAPVNVDNAVEIFDKEKCNEIITGSSGTSVSIKNLKNCVLRFAFSPSANVIDCRLIFAEIESSILMLETNRSDIFAIAQQIRVHDSSELKLHVSVKGAVILEGCRNVVVAPYRLTRNGKQICKSDGEQWKKPLDFDWLSSDPSPNWQLLDEESWVEEELI